MNEQEIIKALKENLAKFIDMSKLERQKAEKIGKSEFEVLRDEGDWVNPHHPCRVFENDMRYRLSPDYTPAEPKVVKCEVRKEEVYKNGKWLRYGSGGHQIDFAPADPDFIGFLYEDGIVSSLQRMYGIDDIGDRNFYVEEKDLDRTRLLTPTHVLFKRKK